MTSSHGLRGYKAACRPAVECYKPRQRQTTIYASEQNNTGPFRRASNDGDCAWSCV